MMVASTMPGMPQICQSEVKISAISAAMAPSVMPKFRPMPAMIGISSERIRKALRLSRFMISLSRNVEEKPDMGRQISMMMMNMMGTALFPIRFKIFLPVEVFVPFIVSPPICGSGRRESCRWRRPRG